MIAMARRICKPLMTKDTGFTNVRTNFQKAIAMLRGFQFREWIPSK